MFEGQPLNLNRVFQEFIGSIGWKVTNERMEMTVEVINRKINLVSIEHL